jgi:voltage-gated potassium channel
MKNASKKAILSILLLIFINAVGVIGYMVIEGWNFRDSLFMTIITITTVGYGEVHDLSPDGEIFTIVLLVFGVGIILYLLGVEAKFLFEGQIEDIIGRKRLEKKIRDLKDHYIICGFGRMGRVIAKEFALKNIETLIIEKAHVPDIEKGDYLVVQGNASNEDVLLNAGVENAKGLISVLSSDADNLYLVLSARELNPDLFIVARASEESTEKKLLRAGADRVVSPYHTGGLRIANSILKPAVVDFIEYATKSGNLELQLEEVLVTKGSRYHDISLKETGIGRELGIIVVAIKKEDGTMKFNPSSDSVIKSGDTLVALGETSKLKKLERIAGHQFNISNYTLKYRGS